MRRHLALVFFAVSLLVGLPAAAQTPATLTAIRAGRLLDPESGQLLANQTILIEGTRIRDVGPTWPFLPAHKLSTCRT